MATTNPCGGLSQTIESGSICNPGYNAGVYLFETKPSAITEANAKLEATWEALGLLAMTNRLNKIDFFQVEPGESSLNEIEGAGGEKIVESANRPTNTYKMISSLAGKKSIYGQLKDGADLYAIFYTSKGYLRGKEVTPNTIEAVKYRVTSTLVEQAPKEFGYVQLHFSALEEFEEYETLIQPDFDPSTIDSVKSMTFTAGTLTTTSFPITVKDLNKKGITDLDTVGAGNFTVYNNTTSSSVTVTGITRSGYIYTLAFTAQSSSDSLTGGYGAPSVTSEFYELNDDITAIIP